jgi:serine/threonine protein kinase
MFPGENETDQINCIIKILGNLPEELVNMFYKNPIYEGKKLINITKPETIERRYMEKLGPTAIDFMKGLLQLDPKKRLNSETVFKHRYFAPFMKEEEEKKKKLNEIHNNKLIENNQIRIKNEDKNVININNNILKIFKNI